MNLVSGEYSDTRINHVLADLNSSAPVINMADRPLRRQYTFDTLNRHIDNLPPAPQTEEKVAKVYTSLLYYRLLHASDAGHPEFISQWAAALKVRGGTLKTVKKAWAGLRFEAISEMGLDVAQLMKEITCKVYAAMEDDEKDNAEQN